MSSGNDTRRRALRRQAEERLRARPAGPRVEATEDVLRLIHELQVHQIELELQNEELRRARDELEASATRYSELYDFAPISYVTLDARSKILEINLVGSTLLGKDRAHVVGQRFASWVTPATRPALEGLLATLQREERASCDLAITRADRPVHLHVDAVPEAPARAAEWRCRAALTDVTEVKAAAAQIRESDRRKSAFLAVLSHELRNPLAPITNAIHLLERVAPGSEQAVRARAVIVRQTAQLTRLVDDLLDLTRIERGKIDLKPEVVDLREIVRRTCDDYRAMFEQRDVELHVTDPAGPVTVRGDAARIAQIMGNLLHNAAKFTPTGGVVAVVVDQAAGRAELRVRDTGVGVALKELGRLFEPFARVEQGPRTGGGLGLGLSLVKGLVEMHGGTVAVASDGLGHGAEFVVTLPLAPAGATSRPAEVRKPPSRSIVIIEDNTDAAATLADLLALDGHQIHVASDGRSGVELVRRVRPDVVFCDLGLPDLSGYEVARALRADEALRDTRFVALSGYAQPEDRERSREAGFEAHLAKPPDIAALNAVLAGHG